MNTRMSIDTHNIEMLVLQLLTTKFLNVFSRYPMVLESKDDEDETEVYVHGILNNDRTVY